MLIEPPLIDGARIDAERLLRWESWLAELIRFPSTFGNEGPATEFVSARLAELGLRPHLVALDTSRSNVVCKIAGNGAGRSLVLNAHLDVVPAGDERGWNEAPYSGHIDRARGLIFGRGALDDKAGITILLALVDVLRTKRLAGDLVFQFVLDDETTGNGTLKCLESGWLGDAALIVDGTRMDRAVSQHAGQLQFGIELEGRPVSVSVSHLGVNAAELLARLVIELREAVFELNGSTEPPWSRFPSPFQFVVQRLESKGLTATVPDYAEAGAYVTFPPPFSLRDVRTLLENATQRFAQRLGVAGSIRLVWNGRASEPVSSESPELIAALADTASSLGMPQIDIAPSTGYSDMQHFVERGIPCLLYGPGAGSNPHRPDESYELSDLPRMVAFYAAFIQRWCSAT